MDDKVLTENEKIVKRNILVNKHQYLIAKIAHQFDDIPDSQQNLEEVGYLGLLNAAHLYDIKVHKINFKTYAQILITEEMHQYLLNRNRQVECPDWLQELNKQVNNFVIEYREKYERFPQINEIASHFNITDNGLSEILKARNALRETYLSFNQESISKNVHFEYDLKKIKNKNYQTFKLPIEDLITLRRAFKRIKELKENIIYYLFVLDLNQTKLAQALGISSYKKSK